LNYTLLQGRTFGVRVRARHNLSKVWSDWSPSSWVQANAAPSVPTPHSPANNDAFNTKPKLVVLATDPDQSPTELSVVFEIATDRAFENIVSTWAVQQTVGGTTPGTRGRFERDTTSLSLVLGTTYYWRAYSHDGFIYSGATTSGASASRSTPRSFTYADVPGVTITSPATIATMSPTITWTSSQPQTKYQVLLTDSNGTTVYDSGEVTSETLQHQVTAEGWLNGNEWNNGETLNVVVRVLNALWGTSVPQATTLTYTYPDTPTSVAVMAITPQGHVGTTAIRVDHDPTGYSEGVFAWYRYYRTPISGPGGAAIGETRRLLTNTNPAEPWLEDHTVESGQWYRYDVTQGTYSGVDVIESLAMSGEAMAQWHGLVLNLPYQPGLYNIHLRFGLPDESYQHTTTIRQARNTITGPASRRRVAAFGRRQDKDANAAFSLIHDRMTGLSGAETRDRLQSLIDCANGADSPDGKAHIVCWREGRGGRHGVLEGIFTDDTSIQIDSRYRDVWIASLALEDAEFVLGEVAD
jgi:hypothetical protein